jgi:aminoglycoside phosphotransferase (APT) family kinase protein
MKVTAPWLMPAVWGAIVGGVLTMILGFSWMGWVLGGTAERMAEERSGAAVVMALTPSCVARFMQEPNAAAKLKELQAVDTWRQREFVEAGGWATTRGTAEPHSGVASACAEQLLKTSN